MEASLEERRNSPSKIEVFKEKFVATGARFRPPFTPSNSLMSPPPLKNKLRRTRALDGGGSPIYKVQSTIPESRTHCSRRFFATSRNLPSNDERTMRSSSLLPNRTLTNREFSSPHSISSNQYSMRASSSNVSENSFSTPRTNRRFSHVKSRIDANSNYTPPPSKVKIFHQPLRINAKPKVGSLQNASHVPSGGNVRIQTHKLSFKDSAKPRVDAKSTIEIPKSEKKISNQKLVWKAEPKVCSLANANHTPKGGNVKIFHQPLHLNAVQSKVGSLENAYHVPAGGDVKISEYKVRSASRSNRNSQTSRNSSANNSRRASSVAAFNRLANGAAKLRLRADSKN